MASVRTEQAAILRQAQDEGLDIYIQENRQAIDTVTLSDAELAQIDSIFPPNAAAGTRYNEESMRAVNG